MPLRQVKNPGDTNHTGWLPEDLRTPNGMIGLADALYEGNPDMVLVVGGDGRIAGANSRTMMELRYLRQDLEGQPLELLLPMATQKRHEDHMRNYMKHPTPRAMGSCMNLSARDSRGVEFPVDVMLWPLEAGSGKYVIAVCHRLDASQARAHTQIHALVENAREYAVNLVDAAGRILTWNEGSRRIYNLTGSEALGKYYSVLFTREEVAAGEPERQIEEASQSSSALFSRGWRTGEGGNPIWAEIEFKAARDPNGELNGFSRVLHDLTPYKRAEEELLEAVRLKAQVNADLGVRVAERTLQLATSLDELRARKEEIEALVAVVSNDLSEKEVLLREVYHRVKNNMQVVRSLLKMSARTLRSRDARLAIETAAQRVYVMAMVHERLYQVPDLANLALSDFLRDVVEGAVASNCARPDQVLLKFDIDEIPIPLDLAIPLGLLANELVSNCLKHGLPNGRAGTISVAAKIVPGAVRFAVQDDGPGLPENFDAAKCASMGVKLAASLAHQLGGRLEFSSNPGCRVQAQLTRLGLQPAVIATTHGQPRLTPPHPMCRA